MTDSGEDLSAFVQRHLEGAITFEARAAEQGDEIRERSKATYGETLLHARLQILAIAEAAYVAQAGEPGRTSTSISDRLILISAFFQGVGKTEALISEGHYPKAAAALKQDLEILTRVHETLQGVALTGRTPNVKYAPTGAGRLYGQLNDVAHPSTPSLLAQLVGSMEVGGARGVTYVPTFVQENALGLYEVHVWLLLEMCRELIRLMYELYGDEPAFHPLVEWWLAVGQSLVEGGHISEGD